MTTTRITEKLSTLLLSQLPEYIQSDFTTFRTFLEAYYEFLEQDQGAQELLQNSRSYNDVDRTIDSFIEYFLKQYSNDIPRDVLYNKKALVKNIQDLYANKGNEKSYKLLFRILFDKEVEIFNPSTQILRSSDGKWVQRNSFFMRTIVGDGLTILNNNLLIESSNSKHPILIKSRKVAFSSVGASSRIHEYFFDNSKNVPVEIGNTIEFQGFKGEVVGVPVAAEITSPGTGFSVGNILPLVSGLGNTAKLKVTKVSPDGGILNVQFINFGIGYTGDFYNFFSSSLGVVSETTFNFSAGIATITDNLSGFVETGTITTQTYAVESFFANDYQGDILSEFFTSTTSGPVSGQPIGGVTASLGLASDAAIYIDIGSKVRYPGYYETNDGFISDQIFIQDRDFYQPYSYVLKIDERFDLYKKAVLDILHPAGMKLFGELTLNASIDISAEIIATLRYLVSNLQDIFGTNDDGNAKDVTKVLADSAGTDEFVAKSITKLSSDDFFIEDLSSLLTSTNYVNSFSTSDDGDNKDIGKNIGDPNASPYADISYFLEDYTFAFFEFFLVEDNFTFVFSYELPINNISIIDSGSIITLDYDAESYFAEVYAGSIVTF